MEYLFELTTVLAGLKNLPSSKKLENILHEGKKGNQIVMFGREVSFGRTRKGVINFKQSKLQNISNVCRQSSKTKKFNELKFIFNRILFFIFSYNKNFR